MVPYSLNIMTQPHRVPSSTGGVGSHGTYCSTISVKAFKNLLKAVECQQEMSTHIATSVPLSFRHGLKLQ